MNCEEWDLVGDFMFSQERAPQTHQSVFEISWNTGIHQLSVGRITHDLFRATHPEENNVPFRFADVFLNSVAT